MFVDSIPYLPRKSKEWRLRLPEKVLRLLCRHEGEHIPVRKVVGASLVESHLGCIGCQIDVDCDYLASYITTAQVSSWFLWPFADDSQEGCTMVPNCGLLAVSGPRDSLADNLGTIQPQCNDSSITAGLSE